MVQHTSRSHPAAAPAATTPSELSEEKLRQLLHQMEHTHEGMYSCAETFDLLDEYVDLVANKEEAALLMPYVRRHLDLCPDCREEYEILLRILQTDYPTAA